jgi:hypothetical protein
MKLFGFLAKRRLEFVSRRTPLNAKDFVKIAFGHEYRSAHP